MTTLRFPRPRCKADDGAEVHTTPTRNFDDARFAPAQATLGCAPTVYCPRPERLPRGRTGCRAKMVSGSHLSPLTGFRILTMVAAGLGR